MGPQFQIFPLGWIPERLVRPQFQPGIDQVFPWKSLFRSLLSSAGLLAEHYTIGAREIGKFDQRLLEPLSPSLQQPHISSRVWCLVCGSPPIQDLGHNVPKLSTHKLFYIVPNGVGWSTVEKFPAAANMFSVWALEFSLGSPFGPFPASECLLVLLDSRAVSNSQCVAELGSIHK